MNTAGDNNVDGLCAGELKFTRPFEGVQAFTASPFNVNNADFALADQSPNKKPAIDRHGPAPAIAPVQYPPDAQVFVIDGIPNTIATRNHARKQGYRLSLKAVITPKGVCVRVRFFPHELPVVITLKEKALTWLRKKDTPHKGGVLN